VIETKLVTQLKPIVGGKMFADVAPSGTVGPWAVYQQVGGKPTQYVEQAMAPLRNGLFQITVWATTRSEATMKSLLIEREMLKLDMAVEVVGSMRATYEPDTKLHGAIQDFSIWENTDE